MNDQNYKLEIILNNVDNGVKAYIEEAEKLIDYVNNQMGKRNDIVDLIGNTPLALMMDNHRNHINFISGILIFKDIEVLMSTLPWVYKTYRSKGYQYDYFYYELCEWKNAISKLLPPQSANALLPLYDFMLEYHNECIRLSEEMKHHNNSKESTWDDIHERILHALINGDYKLIIEILENDYCIKDQLINIYQEVLQPVMYEIGERWSKNEISIAREHLASSTLSRIMSILYNEYMLDTMQKGVAIISSGVNEYHQLGARMVADALESDGWNIYFLGADTPIHELVELMNELNPVFVGLSVTMMSNVHKVDEAIKAIRLSNKLVKIMVGGRAVNLSYAVRQKLDADVFPKDIIQTLKFANDWVEVRNK